jgi:outer membrane protein OmpA-like peptidoglycan-associated protein
LKIGIHIKPGGSGKKANKQKDFREMQKEFYRSFPDLIKNIGNNTIIIRDTLNPAVNVYTAAPANYFDGGKLSQTEKENVNALFDFLNNITILFDLDKDIPKIDDKNFIFMASEILKKEPSLSLIIEGYTCDWGSEKHNRDLALRRAGAVRNMFVERGVSPLQLQVAAYIANDPVSKINNKNKSRERQRTVLFRIVKDVNK